MDERDRFELDLAAALRAYVVDAPTYVHPTELARHFAVTYPHGRTALGPWRLAAVLRPALVLLLLAALLAVLGAGALFVGSRVILPAIEVSPTAARFRRRRPRCSRAASRSAISSGRGRAT